MKCKYMSKDGLQVLVWFTGIENKLAYYAMHCNPWKMIHKIKANKKQK